MAYTQQLSTVVEPSHRTIKDWQETDCKTMKFKWDDIQVRATCFDSNDFECQVMRVLTNMCITGEATFVLNAGELINVPLFKTTGTRATSMMVRGTE
jgi:hypothetical protein